MVGLRETWMMREILFGNGDPFENTYPKKRKKKLKYFKKKQPTPKIDSYGTQGLSQAEALLAHQHTVKSNKSEVQILTVEEYQWYSIQLAKAVCTSIGRPIIQRIYLDGLERGHRPFVNRIVKSEPVKNKPNVFYDPVIKPLNPQRRVRKWFIPWTHNKRLPSFITYSPLPFIWQGKWCRLVDIDYGGEAHVSNQLINYCDTDIFKFFYDKICSANTVARKIEKHEVFEMQKFLQTTSHNIVDILGEENIMRNPDYTGAGFRVILMDDSKDKLKKRIKTLRNEHLICSSNTIDYHPMKLYSPQTLRVHFQTEIDPHHKDFIYSNPSFFYVNFHQQLRETLFKYFQSFYSTYYNQPNPDQRMREMVEKQVQLEKETKKWVGIT